MALACECKVWACGWSSDGGVVIGCREIKKRKGAVKEAKAKKLKPAKKVKDPNAPKRPQTAFFIFL